MYEAGDQRNPPDSEKPENQSERYHEGKQNSHKALDSKDERSIANKLDRESRVRISCLLRWSSSFPSSNYVQMDGWLECLLTVFLWAYIADS